MTKLSLIVAFANNQVIGINNTLPWHLPEDLKRFRALTMGHHIIMGRKTYESLGRLLPGRVTVIVTRNKDYKVEGALIAHSLQAALVLAAGDAEPFIIGGAELYQEGLKLATKLYITEVHAEFAGDAFFPEIDLSHWNLSEKKDHSSLNGLEYSDLIYLKK
jgi:dihydrofolate reductase